MNVNPHQRGAAMNTADGERRPSESASTLEALAGKYLTFLLGEGEYGVPVRKVREIVKLAPITEVPNVAPWMKGVINLRGKVIPIVDLRKKFGLTAKDYTERTCIVVLETAVRGNQVLIGIIVDSVSDVVNITGDQLEEAPNFGALHRSSYVDGLAKVKGAVKILLNLDDVCSAEGEAEALASPVA
jgi:purine-binding chemotaxis protein CheW